MIYVFLNGDLYEEIFMFQLESFCCEKKKEKLKKTFYDFKQENQTWCWKTNTFLQKYGMLGTIPTMTSTY